MGDSAEAMAALVAGAWAVGIRRPCGHLRRRTCGRLLWCSFSRGSRTVRRQLGPRRLAWRTLAWWSPVRRRLGLGRRVGISLLGLRLRLRLRLWLLRPQCLLRISWLCLRVWLLSGGSPKSSERKQPRRFCRRALCLLLCHARYGAVGLRLWLAQKAHPQDSNEKYDVCPTSVLEGSDMHGALGRRPVP